MSEKSLMFGMSKMSDMFEMFEMFLMSETRKDKGRNRDFYDKYILGSSHFYI